MGLSLEELDAPLDDIAFLSRSNNRVRVMSELASGGRTRRELRESIDVSKPTLGRVLAGFEERDWIRSDGREYALTPIGRLLAEEFEGMMETVEATQELRDLAPRLPLEEMDFDIRLLSEARITRPTPEDASAHVRREEALLAESEQVRFLCNQAHPPTVEAYRDRVVEDGLSMEAIITGDAIDAASEDPAMRPHLRDLVESDRATIYRTDDPVSVMVGLIDDLVSIVPLDESGVPCAFIESERDPVREWVSDTLADYRAGAEAVEPDALRAR